MASTNITNSTLVGLYIGGTLVAHLTDASMEIGHSPRDITSKDSAGWAESLEGLRNSTLSCTAWLNEAAAQNAEDIFALISTRATASVKWGSSVSGDLAYTVTAWVTSLSLNSPSQEDNVSYSISLQGTGSVAEAAVV